MLQLMTDEDLPRALVRVLKQRQADLDVVRLQEVGLLSQPDHVVLAWAAENDRVLISGDRKTMIREAYQRVLSGQWMPGLVILRSLVPLNKIAEEILIVACCVRPDEIQNNVIFLPL